MFSITLAWTTHELAIYSYNAFHLQTDSFYPITEDQLKIIGLYHTEESVKSIMTGDELQAGYATLEKSNFRIAKFLNFIPGLDLTDYSSNGYIDTSFHFMDFLAVHTRIFYLFTKVNYTNFHVSLCFNISYKDKKKQSIQTDNNTLITNNITNKRQGIV